MHATGECVVLASRFSLPISTVFPQYLQNRCYFWLENSCFPKRRSGDRLVKPGTGGKRVAGGEREARGPRLGEVTQEPW
jgi:hypothetical protein